MEIQNLQAFIKVAEEGSFSLAAEKLHLTQPAVSKRVAGLESRLDKPLFDRIGRRISLTEAGQALLPHARNIIQNLDRAEQAIRDLTGDVAGRLLLGTSHHIGLHRLPPVLRRFNHNYSAVKLDVAFMDSEQAYDQVMQGKLELAVVTLAPESDASIVTTPVWTDPLEFMASTEHPLAQAERLSLMKLSEYPVILPGMNTYTGQIAKQIFDREGLNLNIAMSTNYLETIRMMASIGLGWTVLPRSMLDDNLKALSVPVSTPQRTLGLIYHRGRSLSNAAQAFISELLH
jgi:DNA-binding transcriptional LysR family regulator